MSKPKIATLGALKKTAYQPQSIQEELAKNLRDRLQKGEPTFEGLIGYENTVIPDRTSPFVGAQHQFIRFTRSSQNTFG